MSGHRPCNNKTVSGCKTQNSFAESHNDEIIEVLLYEQNGSEITIQKQHPEVFFMMSVTKIMFNALALI